MKIKNTELKIVQSDITELAVSAIVNAANSKLLMDKGLSGSIKAKGGKEIEQEALKKGPIALGDVVCTAAGNLKAEYIIHAATRKEDSSTDEYIIRRACANAFKKACELKTKSLAFPALGCGIGQFPLVGAAKIMAQEIFNLFRSDAVTLEEIIICLYDEKTFQVFDNVIYGYLKRLLNPFTKSYVTVDAIIEFKEGIILIERSNPPYGWALPGGFMDYAESLEDAVRREAKEETNLDLVDLRQLHTYSEPNRDARFHTVSTVFIARGEGDPKFGDDAKGLKIVKYEELTKLDYAFDHKKVIEDYLKTKKGGSYERH